MRHAAGDSVNPTRVQDLDELVHLLQRPRVEEMDDRSRGFSVTINTQEAVPESTHCYPGSFETTFCHLGVKLVQAVTRQLKDQVGTHFDAAIDLGRQFVFLLQSNLVELRELLIEEKCPHARCANVDTDDVAVLRHSISLSPGGLPDRRSLQNLQQVVVAVRPGA